MGQEGRRWWAGQEGRQEGRHAQGWNGAGGRDGETEIEKQRERQTEKEIEGQGETEREGEGKETGRSDSKCPGSRWGGGSLGLIGRGLGIHALCRAPPQATVPLRGLTTRFGDKSVVNENDPLI